VCQVASGAKHVVGSAASSLVGFGANSVLNALGSWVSDGATWLLRQIGSVMSTTTAIDLGASWFTSHYQIMVALAGVVIVPILLLGIMQSIYRQNGSALVRSVLVNVPLSILLTAVAVKLVQLGLAITDAMSAAIAQGAGLDSGHFLASVTVGLSVTSGNESSAPAFVMFVGGLAVVFGALMVWVELLIRAAAVYVAVLFLPLALASLAWPAIAHWCRRLVDTLVALVLGKFVIVAVLSLAAGALAGGTASVPGGGTGAGAGGSGPGSPGGGFAAVLGGAALLLLAAFAPWALFRLLPFLEAGAVSHLESVSHRARQRSSAPVKGLAQVAMRAATGSLAGGASGSMGGLLGGWLAGSGSGGPGSAGSGSGSGGPGSGGPGSAGPGSAGSFGLSGLGGASSRGGAGGAEPGPGGDGPQGTRPDTGPSSAESTGVGTTESPGHGIPAWAVHPQATATARRSSGSGAAVDADSGSLLAAASIVPGSSAPAGRPSPAGPSGSAGGPGSSAGSRSQGGDAGHVKQLPRQTGALRADTLGRDELGVRLISAPIGPELPDRRGPDRDTQGDHGL
jgi:hypothetical protein